MKLVSIFFVMVCNTMAFSQSFTGKVLEASTQEPIAFATVYILETKSALFSNENGQFTLDENLPNKITLQISHLGHEELVTKLDLLTTTEKTYYLQASYIKVDEVSLSVAAGKLGRENVVQVDRRNIAELENSGQQTLAASLGTLPGVDQVSTGAGIGKPVIRGLSGNRIVTYAQGIRLENQQFGDEHGLGESANGIEAVEVIKGPASLLYGADAIGGVLYLVDEKFAYHHKTEGYVATDFSSNALTSANKLGVKTNIGEVHWNIFGAFNTSADYNQAINNRAYNTRFNELSFKTALGFHAKNYVGNVRYGLLKNNFGIPEGEDEPSTTVRKMILPSQDVQHHTVSIENSFFSGDNAFIATLGYGNNRRKEFEDDLNTAALEMVLGTFTYNVKAKIPFAEESFELTTGLQGMLQDNENKADEILIPNGKTQDIGGYGVLSYYPNGASQIQGGLRFDRRNINTDLYSNSAVTIPAVNKSFNSLNVSLGAHHELGKFQLRANVASGFRPPTMAELLSDGEHEGSGRYEKGNVNLESEIALQFDAGISFNNDHIEVSASPFYNRLNNYIFLQPIGAIIDGADVFEYHQTKAKLYGGEVGVHLHPHKIHWLHIESDMSLLWAEDNAGNYLPFIPHNKINAQLRAEFSENKVIKSIFLKHVLKLKQNRASAFETESKGYGLVNLGANGQMNLGKQQLRLNAGVDNVFNAQYIDHLSRLKNDGVLNPGINGYLGLMLVF